LSLPDSGSPLKNNNMELTVPLVGAFFIDITNAFNSQFMLDSL